MYLFVYHQLTHPYVELPRVLDSRHVTMSGFVWLAYVVYSSLEDLPETALNIVSAEHETTTEAIVQTTYHRDHV